MIKLYDHPNNTNSRKIHAIARECDIAIDLVPLDLMKGEGQKPEFLAINPNGKIPAMVDGSVKLFESNAILCYIAAKHDSPLLPRDPAGRGKVDQWLFWQTAHLSVATHKIAMERVYKSLLNLGAPDPLRIEEGLVELNRYLTVLDKVLATHEYVCGKELTVADYAICGALAKDARERIHISDDVLKFRHVARWLALVESRPAWVHAS